MNPEDRKVMEMARDALKCAQHEIDCTGDAEGVFFGGDVEVGDKVSAALAALNARLAQEEDGRDN